MNPFLELSVHQSKAIGAARQLSGISNAFTNETASGLISQQS